MDAPSRTNLHNLALGSGVVHHAFETQAERKPEAVAISFQGEQVSYRELNERSNVLAHALIDCGLQSQQPVAMMLDDGPEQVVSLLAILKAGGVIASLDPTQPDARLAKIIEQTRPSITINDASFADRCRLLLRKTNRAFSSTLTIGPDGYQVDLKGDGVSNTSFLPIAELPHSNPESGVESDYPVYIVYTSGSTGLPKGIVQSHRSFRQFITWQSEQFGIKASQRFAQWASVAYDAGYRQIFGTLCFGGTLCMAPSRVRYNPDDLADWLKSERVTILNLVPSFCSEFLKGLESRAQRSDSSPLPDLEQLLLTGEVLPVGLARAWRELYSDQVRLFNLYGPSECVLASFCEITDVGEDQRSIPIGTAIAGREILILDESQQPCANGETGEIYVRSEYLTLGYLGNAAATSEKYFQNPCHNDFADPVYRTGDLGRFRDDGKIEFIGRVDSQIKLRGMRVELGEIEAELRTVPGIENCAVVVQQNLRKRKNLISKDREARRKVESCEQQVLIAYYCGDDGISNAELRDALAERLPAHMIPQQCVQLDEMPLNANKKLDRQALAVFDYAAMADNTDFVAPRDEHEMQIARICAEVLDLERLSIHDSFFEAGGDSLLAMQVLNRLRREMSADFSFRDLLEHQTIAKLAAQVEAHRAIVPTQNPVRPVAIRKSDLPLTAAQQGIWFLWRLEPESPYYTGQGTLQLSGELDVAALKAAWRALHDRHQILRVRFGVKDGQPVQSFPDGETTDLEYIDLSHMTPENQWCAIEAAAAEKTKRALNLEQDRLFQGKLFKLTDTEHQLLLSFHEIVLDLWGLSLLVRDLDAIYLQLSTDIEAPLPATRTSFGEYALWEQQQVTRENLQSQKSYWEKQLDGELPVLQLPTDRPRPINPSYRGDSQNIVLTAEESQGLRQIACDSQSTLFMTLLTAFKILLKTYSGQDDIIVGAPIANRTREGAEDLAGFFLNMLPLRTRFGNDQSFFELMTGVKETVTGAICNADYPFMWMLEDIDVQRDRSTTPVFQVMFNMLNLPQASSRAGELEITYNEIDTPYIKYDLCLYSQEHDGQIFLELSYLTELFDASTAKRILDNYRVLLSSIVANPHRPLSELQLINDSERSQLLLEFNDTDVDFDNERCIHELFEHQVRQTPDRTAFFSSEGSISYSQLNARSNKLARHLQDRGAKRGTRIALCLDRGFDMIAGLLAVMKVGGIYVALDPQFPPSRLQDMLVDTGATMLVLHQRNDSFSGFDGSKILIDRDWEQIDDHADSDLPCRGQIDDDLNIVYTSSTTGAPKGVLINMQAVLNRLFWMWDEHPFQSGSVAVLQKSYSLVAATWEIFGALLRGYPTLILSRDELLDSGQMWSQLASYRVTHLLASPAVIEGILSESERRSGEWQSLRFATTSAEPVSPAMVRRWKSQFANVRLFNLYGSTECSSNVTQFDTTELTDAAARVPIGKPLPNTRVYILDNALQPVPLGAVGEMCVSGACLASGYLNNAELNDSHFVPDPFSTEPGARLYKTGDLARFQSDGTIELIGRADRQVKVRGFRVELGDVENSLLQHEHVQKSAVVLRHDDAMAPRLTAYLVATEDISQSDVRSFLKQQLPDYMIPVDYVFLDALPITAAGKVNVSALPAPDQARPTLAVTYVGPGSDTEVVIADIWQQLLGVDSVGIHDDFFDLGGHSLMASAMLFRVKDVTGVELPLRVLFEDPSVAALAARVENMQLAGTSAANDAHQFDREEVTL